MYKKINILLLVIFLCLTVTNIQAEQSLLSECMNMASPYNAGLPMRVDNATTVTGVGCKIEKNRVILFYNGKMDKQKSKYNPVSGWKKNRIVPICTNPRLNALLNFLDMQYIYYDSTNAYMGEFTIRKEDCR